MPRSSDTLLAEDAPSPTIGAEGGVGRRTQRPSVEFPAKPHGQKAVQLPPSVRKGALELAEHDVQLVEDAGALHVAQLTAHRSQLVDEEGP